MPPKNKTDKLMQGEAGWVCDEADIIKCYGRIMWWVHGCSLENSSEL